MYADFVLKDGDKVKETATVLCVTKRNPLLSNGYETDDIEVKLGNNIFTKKELNKYKLEVYVYKDKKFKTHVGTYAIPTKGIKKSKVESDIDALIGN